MKNGTGGSASAPHFIINITEVKVKVQGQNCRTENLSIAVARPWFKICTKFGNPTKVTLVRNTTFDKTEDGVLAEVCTL